MLSIKHNSYFVIKSSDLYTLLFKFCEFILLFNPINIYSVISTPVGIYCFDLRGISPEWVINEKMPKSTEFENTNKVKKEYFIRNLKIKKMTYFLKN